MLNFVLLFRLLCRQRFVAASQFDSQWNYLDRVFVGNASKETFFWYCLSLSLWTLRSRMALSWSVILFFDADDPMMLPFNRNPEHWLFPVSGFACPNLNLRFVRFSYIKLYCARIRTIKYLNFDECIAQRKKNAYPAQYFSEQFLQYCYSSRHRLSGSTTEAGKPQKVLLVLGLIYWSMR